MSEQTRPPTEDLVSRLKVAGSTGLDLSPGDPLAWDAAECLEAALPFLRAHAKSCEACEGSGEKIVGHAPDDYWSEPCVHCKPIWDLVERIQPPRPIPVVAPAAAAVEEDNDLF